MTVIKRKANAGERIKIVNANFTFGDYANGAEMVVEKRVNDRAVLVGNYGVPNGVAIIADYEYVVLEPDADSAPITVLLPDESLGGVLREYREVKRKANVGERIKIVAAEWNTDYANGDVFTALEVDADNDVFFTDNAGDRECVFYREYVVLEPTYVLRIGTERFRMVDRKAAVGDYVLITSGSEHLRKGALIPFNERAYYASPSVINYVDGTYGTCGAQFRVLEPLTSAEQTAPLSELPLAEQYAENITVLTRKVAQLEEELRVAREDIVLIEEGVRDDIKALERRADAAERRILALETDSAPALVPSYVEVASGPVDKSERAALPTYIKSAQQIRDEIVERAKADIVKLAGGMTWFTDGAPLYEVETPRGICGTYANFVINRDKRTVVALMTGKGTGTVYTRGIAKCAPGDVFNAALGRAIALRRALGLEVPTEYLTCPQPEEVRVGDELKWRDGWLFRLTGIDGDSYSFYSHRSKRPINGVPYIEGISQYCSVIDDSREDGGNSASPSALKGAA